MTEGEIIPHEQCYILHSEALASIYMVSTPPHSGLTWQPSVGAIECYEARIVTNWSEYIRGVVIAEQSRGSAGGYTAYVEYFKFGVARQLWGKRVFADRDQAKMWCAGEITRLQGI